MGIFLIKETEPQSIFPKEILMNIIHNVGYDQNLNYSDYIALPLLLTIACTNKFLNIFINTDETFNNFFADKHGTNIQFYKEAVLRTAHPIKTNLELFLAIFDKPEKLTTRVYIGQQHTNIYRYFNLSEPDICHIDMMDDDYTLMIIEYDIYDWKMSIYKKIKTWSNKNTGDTRILYGKYISHHFVNFSVPLARILCAKLRVEPANSIKKLI